MEGELTTVSSHVRLDIDGASADVPECSMVGGEFNCRDEPARIGAAAATEIPVRYKWSATLSKESTKKKEKKGH